MESVSSRVRNSVSEGMCCNDCLPGAHFQPGLQLSLVPALGNISSRDCPGLQEGSVGLRSAQAHCVTTPHSPELAWEEAAWQGQLPGGPGASSGSNGSRNAAGTWGSSSPRPSGAALFYLS